MPESRDRLVREVDFAALFARRRASRTYSDELEVALFGSLSRQPEPVDRPGTIFGPGFRPTMASPRANAIRNGRNRHSFRGIENTPTGTARRENWSPRRRRRTSNSVLPSWYPRTPLHDITSITRAIERRRGHLGDVEGHELGSPVIAGSRGSDSFTTPLVETKKFMSPFPASGVRRSPRSKLGKLPKIIHEIANQPSQGSECLTPERKLLNSIDKVEKVVKEELDKLKRTPAAKRAERERRVRTLMSMR
ncbi:Protein POLYCHOME [Linum grandiflorum]